MKRIRTKKFLSLMATFFLSGSSLFGAAAHSKKLQNTDIKQNDYGAQLAIRALQEADVTINAAITDNINLEALEKESQRLAKQRLEYQIGAGDTAFAAVLLKDLCAIRGLITLKNPFCAASLALKNHAVSKILQHVPMIVCKGEVEMFEHVLRYVPESIKMQDKYTGNSLLHSAAQTGQEDMVLQLLVEGIDPLALNAAGRRASELCRHEGIQRVLREAEGYALKDFQASEARLEDLLLSIERDILKSQKKKNKKLAQSAATAAAPSVATDGADECDKDNKTVAAANAVQTATASTATAAGTNSDWKAVTAKIKLPAQPKRIGDRLYRVHALERMAPDTPDIRQRLANRALAMGFAQGSLEYARYIDPRSVTPQEVEATIAQAVARTVNEVTIYKSNGIAVVLNKNGDVVTVIRTA